MNENKTEPPANKTTPTPTAGEFAVNFMRTISDIRRKALMDHMQDMTGTTRNDTL